MNTEPDPRNKGQRYTVAELAFIEQNYSSMTPDAIAAHLGRTTHSVWNQARKLGVAKSHDEFGWKPEHDSVLASIVPSRGVKAAHAALKERGVDRTLKAVQQRSQKLGLKFRDPGAVATFRQAAKLSQPDFFADIAATYQNRTGEELTYKRLSEIAFVSHSRAQKWFAPGSGQQPMNMQIKHYLWLVVRSFQSYSFKSRKKD